MESKWSRKQLTVQRKEDSGEERREDREASMLTATPVTPNAVLAFFPAPEWGGAISTHMAPALSGNSHHSLL